MSKWYQLQGAENDVAISTKVAMARNVKGYNFTVKLTADEKYEIADKIDEILDKKLNGKFATTPMNEVGRDLQISLAERGLVSPEFISYAEGRTMIMTEDESLSIMVCEEDHLKIQAFLPGLELEKTFELADTLDNVLDEDLEFSFDKKLGYLTQCPTNIGTAMRASVTLQLPALSMRGQIPRLSGTVSKLGLVLTGAYGEADNPVGSLFQLSNQVTLGISEQAAIENLKSISLSIIEQERELRKELMNNLKFQDILWRSYGTLKNARVISFGEFMEAMAVVKIGVAAGEINIPNDKLNELIFTMQPATLNVEHGKSLDRQLRDSKRAEAIREVFA
ncbi:MAG: ATP--guanido phosphotransferase [Clostridia bacterium]|nr:ATP--guanido phosphotransferase [Clostridia bacterium]MBR5016037.1 ATP--guanido phosphotransferase [Clostridia bacterium]MBR5991545.1 ATP--guanido phosphotransferase [Clostridia bacterium]MBR6479792.1 ATP--guanido phosphotransferase [Clostridia bacterium]MBR6512739.1 ATP--guanido phosphotransferase [Clostridia bacterium]